MPNKAEWVRLPPIVHMVVEVTVGWLRKVVDLVPSGLTGSIPADHPMVC